VAELRLDLGDVDAAATAVQSRTSGACRARAPVSRSRRGGRAGGCAACRATALGRNAEPFAHVGPRRDRLQARATHPDDALSAALPRCTRIARCAGRRRTAAARVRLSSEAPSGRAARRARGREDLARRRGSARRAVARSPRASARRSVRVALSPYAPTPSRPQAVAAWSTTTATRGAQARAWPQEVEQSQPSRPSRSLACRFGSRPDTPQRRSRNRRHSVHSAPKRSAHSRGALTHPNPSTRRAHSQTPVQRLRNI
jgi:hypothetical protein